MRYAAAWIVGEYSTNIAPASFATILTACTAHTVKSLRPTVQAVYLQCAFKVIAQYAQFCATGALGHSGAPDGAQATFDEVATKLCERLVPFASSTHVEVQERATSLQVQTSPPCATR